MKTVSLIGNLGADPTLKYTPNGKAVVTFSLACSGFDRSSDRVEWFRVTAWERRAELCNQYLTKGMSVYIEGELSTHTYEVNGQTRTSLDVNCSTFEFIGSQQINTQADEPATTDLSELDDILN